MPTPRDCLDLVADARASAVDPESAYVLRTRLKRSVMGVAQLAAARAGVPGPLMPDDIHRLTVDDPASAELVRLSASLLVKTRSLCQPSEALDSRWRSGWSTVRQDLERLEQALEAMSDEAGSAHVGLG